MSEFFVALKRQSSLFLYGHLVASYTISLLRGSFVANSAAH